MAISYKLASELKEAGFPYMGWCPGIGVEEHDLINCTGIPILSELIEACGNQFDALFSGWERIDEGYPRPNQWRADATNKTGYSCAGETPEEAVARLWLVLHKNA